MTSRERTAKTLNFYSPDRAPRELWALPGVAVFRAKEMEEITKQFPMDFICPKYKYGTGRAIILFKTTPCRNPNYS